MTTSHHLPFIASDGGFSLSGMTTREAQGSCMPRAICNVTGWDFREVWEACAACNALTKPYEVLGMDPGILRLVGKRDLKAGTIIAPPFLKLMRYMGFKQTIVPHGLHVPLEAYGYQTGRYVIGVYGHATAVIGGVLYDGFDCQHDANLVQYGVYQHWLWQGE